MPLGPAQSGLHGVISPMNHVGPDDLQIRSLVDRVAQGGVEEGITSAAGR